MERRNFLGLAAAAVVGGSATKVCSQELKVGDQVPKTTGLKSVGLNFEDEQRAIMEEHRHYAEEARDRQRRRKERFEELEQFRFSCGHRPEGGMAVPFATQPVNKYVRGDVYKEIPQPEAAYCSWMKLEPYGAMENYVQQLVEDGLTEHLPKGCELGLLPRPMAHRPDRICSCKYVFDLDEAEFDGSDHKRAGVAIFNMYTGIASEIDSRLRQARECYKPNLPPNRWEGKVIVELPKVIVEQNGPFMECWAYTFCMWEKQAKEAKEEYWKQNPPQTLREQMSRLQLMSPGATRTS